MLPDVQTKTLSQTDTFNKCPGIYGQISFPYFCAVLLFFDDFVLEPITERLYIVI